MAIERVRVKGEADVVVFCLGAQIVEVTAMSLKCILMIYNTSPHGTQVSLVILYTVMHVLYVPRLVAGAGVQGLEPLFVRLEAGMHILEVHLVIL